jgi:hypothetical protein
VTVGPRLGYVFEMRRVDQTQMPSEPAAEHEEEHPAP